MKRILRFAILAVILLFVVIQFIPVDRTNPPVRREVQWSSAEVEEIARRACYDCHSNETVWPWYSYVAPISWRVADHVDHGRHHLNFSEWDARQEDLDDVRGSVKSGAMPLEDYLWLHPEAELDEEALVIFMQEIERTYLADPPGE